MKKVARSIVVSILGWQVRRLRSKNDFVTVGVVGSIGKTSTKFAIARVLKQGKVVRFQQGNYNDLVTVPLIFFNHETPSLLNPLAWLRLFWKNEKQLRKDYPYDVVVVEIGTDGPGQIAEFSRYVHCDIAVVTAITPEHMEYFKDLGAVAQEEFSVEQFSDSLLVNGDLCEKKFYKKFAKKVTTYGQQAKNDITIHKVKFTKAGSQFELEQDDETMKLSMDAYGIGEVYSASAAASVARQLGLNTAQIKTGVSNLQPVSGRMQRLHGIKESLILDDTYNASPVAVIGALDTLYAMKASQKIAILGNMNELGEHARQAHVDVGDYCEPAQLDLVVTIGPEANEHLAPAARKRGCRVETFTNPYTAADFIKERLKQKAVILAKGSQNGVFAEETVKQLLANQADAQKLVRQSKYWMKQKKKNFKKQGV